jgi:hypothetical protein
MTDLKTIDLDALDAPVARVKIGGALHNVLPINGIAQEIIVGMNEQKEMSQVEQLRAARRIIEEIVPTLDEGARAKLGMDKMTRLIELASEPSAAVQASLEKYAGNARRPTRKTAHLAAG